MLYDVIICYMIQLYSLFNLRHLATSYKFLQYLTTIHNISQHITTYHNYLQLFTRIYNILQLFKTIFNILQLLDIAGYGWRCFCLCRAQSCTIRINLFQGGGRIKTQLWSDRWSVWSAQCVT